MPLSSPFQVTSAARAQRSTAGIFGQVLLLARSDGPFDQANTDYTTRRVKSYATYDDIVATNAWAEASAVAEAAQAYFAQGPNVPPLFVGLWDSRADIDTQTTGNQTESVSVALAAINDLNPRLYFVVVDKNIFEATESGVTDPDLGTIATWCASNHKRLLLDTGGSDVLSASETTSTMASFGAASYTHAATIHADLSGTPVDRYAAVAEAGKLAQVNWAIATTFINPKFTRLSGITAVDIDDDDAIVIDSKKGNIYTIAGVNRRPLLYPGLVTCDNQWLDTNYLADWLRYQAQEALERKFYQSVIPYSTRGESIVTGVVDGVMSRVVDSGALVPGRVSEETRQEIEQVTGQSHDGYLTAGYLVYMQPVDEAAETLQAARQFPPIYGWGHASEVVNGVDVSFIVD